MQIGISRIATGTNDLLSPFIQSRYDILSAAIFGCLMCLISFSACIGLTFIAKTKPVHPAHSETESLRSVNQQSVLFSFKDSFKLSRSFWYVFAIVITQYGSIVPFFHICTDCTCSYNLVFQQKWYQNDPLSASFAFSLPDWIAAIGSSVCGIVLDRYGGKANMLPIASLLIICSHILLKFTTIVPLVAMSLIGVAYTLFGAALWPCVPYLVQRNQTGLAYGLLTSALNISLFTFPLLMAEIRKMTDPSDFSTTQYACLALAFISLIFTVMLHSYDSSTGGRLNLKASHHGYERIDSDQSLAQEEEDDAELPDVLVNGINIIITRHHSHFSCEPETLLSQSAPERGRKLTLDRQSLRKQNGQEGGSSNLMDVASITGSRSLSPVKSRHRI